MNWRTPRTIIEAQIDTDPAQRRTVDHPPKNLGNLALSHPLLHSRSYQTRYHPAQRRLRYSAGDRRPRTAAGGLLHDFASQEPGFLRSPLRAGIATKPDRALI